ncbi:MAG: histidine phosphatase family protein [bacterium]
MTLYFVRHGETDVNREYRCQGKIDKPLNGEGRRQAERTASEFGDIKIDIIYASPLLRARQSAEFTAQKKGLPVIIKEWLVEIDHGDLEGLTKAEAEAVAPGLLATWKEHPDTVQFPNGESLKQVEQRFLKGIREVLVNDNGRNILFLTHQVLAGTAMCFFNNLPLKDVWKDKLQNGGYFKFTLDDNKISAILRILMTGDQR